MQKEVYAVRLSAETRNALEAAAASKQVKPRSLAVLLIVSQLQREGYLPKQARRTQAARALA